MSEAIAEAERLRIERERLRLERIRLYLLAHQIAAQQRANSIASRSWYDRLEDALFG